MTLPSEFPSSINLSNFLNSINSFKYSAKAFTDVLSKGKSYRGSSGTKTLKLFFA